MKHNEFPLHLPMQKRFTYLVTEVACDMLAERSGQIVTILGEVPLEECPPEGCMVYVQFPDELGATVFESELEEI